MVMSLNWYVIVLQLYQNRNPFSVKFISTMVLKSYLRTCLLEHILAFPPRFRNKHSFQLYLSSSFSVWKWKDNPAVSTSAMIFSSYDHNNDKFVMTPSLVIIDVSGFWNSW